ncbi:hypothetical protein TRVA0_032S00650 [Trichomonascus vanleenenianus]|uniref:putative proline--tRNA ligase AIM10 n=1 Tax=Trichomonascus vanleenenianus TaxID=2268995 RepID=UPI003EC98F3E
MKRLSRLGAVLNKQIGKAVSDRGIDGTQLLVKSGYVHSTGRSGTYNLLPLGFRVQNKIERVIREEMDSAEGSELSLVSLSSGDLWRKSGRISGSEIYRFPEQDQVLAATCEEEVTNLVREIGVSSYKQLPLRLYQIGKKFRAEKRARGGMLRAREFTMKDMYSFDHNRVEAQQSYEAVKQAYMRIFERLGVPIVVAEADTGTIGGEMSHEYHLLSPHGEDKVANCASCGYTANIEKAIGIVKETSSREIKVEYYLTDDGTDSLVAVYCAVDRSINVARVHEEVGIRMDILGQDALAKYQATEGVDEIVLLQRRFIRVVDETVDETVELPNLPEEIRVTKPGTTTLNGVSVVDVADGDACANCDGELKLTHAIEVAHTFLLGTKYSSTFEAKVLNHAGHTVPIEMGCYGIGVSRLLPCIAETMRDDDGLRWPKTIAPFDCLVVCGDEEVASNIGSLITEQGLSAVWDDRTNQFGQALGASKSLGVPIIIVAGKRSLKEGKVEVQARDGSSSESVDIASVGQYAKNLWNNL